jgi:hypothetical protein
MTKLSRNRLVDSLIVGFVAIVALGFLGILVGRLHPELPPLVQALVVGLPTIIFVETLILITQVGTQEARSYPVALWTMGLVFPITAALSTSACYLLWTPCHDYRTISIAVGFALTLFAWLVATLLYSHATTASSANRNNYNLLRVQLEQLETQWELLKQPPQGVQLEQPNKQEKISRKQVCELVSKHIKKIKAGFTEAGALWTTGDGYIDLWHRIHRAEEELIKVGDKHEVKMEAMQDELRLSGSTMDNKDLLLKRLRCAVAILDTKDTSNHEHVKDQLKNKDQPDITGYLLDNPKIILSEIRYEINNFRDNVWEGLIHARNYLLKVSLFLG